MTETEFASDNGFNSYEAMLMSSEVVFKDASSWLVTPTENGFLAWANSFLDKPLGYFDTFDLAKQEIFDVTAH